MRRRGLLSVAVVAILGISLAAAGERVRVVYTNDLHARLGRLASLGQVIETARAEGAPILLVDSGDAWQDFRVPLSAVAGAEDVVDWMNVAGYAAMAVGNHDLYVGWPAIERLAARARFPVLCAHLAAVDGLASPFAGSTRVAIGTLHVLIVGIGPLEHVPALDVPWLRPIDPVTALRREIDRAPGTPDLVVCLVHASLRQAAELARAVPDVDVFIAGHTHAATDWPRREGAAWIVQSGGFGRAVGVLDLDVAGGEVSLIDHRLVPSNDEAAALDPRGLARLSAIALAVLAFAIALWI